MCQIMSDVKCVCVLCAFVSLVGRSLERRDSILEMKFGAGSSNFVTMP